jgi:flagellar biosynthetic protein FliS
MLSRAARSYRDVDLESAPKPQIVERLFARFQRDCGDAERALAARDIAGKAAAINHATAVVVALRSALDHTASAQLAGNLDALYRFAVEQLAVASSTMKVEPLREAAKIMASLGGAFAKAHASLDGR